MLIGRVDAIGALYIFAGVTPPNVFANGGVLLGSQGIVGVDTSNNPTQFVNGLPVTNEGRLCVAYGGTIAGYSAGLPHTALGRLVTQLNQPISPADVYVGGIRIGAPGGLYVNDLTPPAEKAWSNGFSTGFGL
jgi:hypothetical protein